LRIEDLLHAVSEQRGPEMTNKANSVTAGTRHGDLEATEVNVNVYYERD
jgi:hypothetical protein